MLLRALFTKDSGYSLASSAILISCMLSTYSLVLYLLSTEPSPCFLRALKAVANSAAILFFILTKAAFKPFTYVAGSARAAFN